MSMNTMRQTLEVSQEAQRFGAAEFLRRLAAAIERSPCEVEVELVVLTLRSERLETLGEIRT